MEKHEIAAILSDTRYFIQNSHGDRLYDIEWQYKQGFLGFLALPVAKFTALPGLVGKMYSKIHSSQQGGGTNHKDTKDTKIDPM